MDIGAAADEEGHRQNVIDKDAIAGGAHKEGDIFISTAAGIAHAIDGPQAHRLAALIQGGEPLAKSIDCLSGGESEILHRKVQPRIIMDQTAGEGIKYR